MFVYQTFVISRQLQKPKCPKIKMFVCMEIEFENIYINTCTGIYNIYKAYNY